MKSILSQSGLRVLESLTFTETLYAFDFDGTLAPIVPLPHKAKLTAKVDKLLQDMSLQAPVAIISGRSRSDLRQRLTCRPQHLIGNHGLEGLSSYKASYQKAQRISRSWKSQLSAQWNSLESNDGIFVEGKTYSLAIHYRQSRQKKKSKRELLTLIDSLIPKPRMVFGKSVINLIPLGAPHKGMALLELMKINKAKAALYVGDDDTDEDVFALQDHSIVSVRVGVKRASQAQFFVRHQREIKTLLRFILEKLQSQTTS